MKIILSADDFGQDADTVRATIECFERGALTGASILPTMPNTSEAVEYAKSHPQFSFGVHLTYASDTFERPVLDPSQVPHMVQEDGRFLLTHIIRPKALRGQVPVEEIARETAAQIALLKEQGVPITYVDSHGHLHKLAPFRKAIEQVLPKFGIFRVRGPQNVYLKKRLTSPNIWLGSIWRWKLSRHFAMPKYFYMPTSVLESNWHELILAKMQNMSGGIIEVGVHPGYAEPWRNDERACVQRFAELLRHSHHEIQSWKDVAPPT